jgi:hypothetical protein
LFHQLASSATKPRQGRAEERERGLGGEVREFVVQQGEWNYLRPRSFRKFLASNLGSAGGAWGL